MNWLNPAAEKFHKSTKSRLLYEVAEEHHVRSFNDFMKKFSNKDEANFDNRVEYETAEDFANSPDASSLYRCFPAQNQPYMFLTNNPGIALDVEHALHQAIDNTVDEIAGVCRVYIVDYLMKRPKFTNLLKGLSEIATKGDLAEYTSASSYLQEEKARSWRSKVESMEAEEAAEWISNNPSAGPSMEEGFLKDFYYSVAYKLESTSTDYLTDSEKSLSKEMITDEIRSVDPEVIICSGGWAWDVVRANMNNVVPIEDSQYEQGIMKAQGGVFRANIANETRTIIAARHPSVLHKKEKLIQRAESAGVF